MAGNHGWIRDEDVEKVLRPSGDSWIAILIHDPTRTRVEVKDRSSLVAETKAWIRLRDKLEGL